MDELMAAIDAYAAASAEHVAATWDWHAKDTEVQAAEQARDAARQVVLDMVRALPIA